ncbi:MAG: hypothetical protein IPM39_28465 [Chloroflexi bacterium]|nr:hypothetical protein [Chloroflexota bacterium]
MRQAYSRVIRQAIGAVCAGTEVASDDVSDCAQRKPDAAREASESFLAQWPVEKRPFVLLGTAAYLYVHGPQNGEPVRDALIWQLGAKRDGSGRESGIARAMLDALRQIDRSGDPIWTTSGAVLSTTRSRKRGVPAYRSG